MSTSTKARLTVAIQQEIAAIKSASKELTERNITLQGLQAKFEAIQAAEDLAKQSKGKTKTVFGTSRLGRAGKPTTPNV